MNKSLLLVALLTVVTAPVYAGNAQHEDRFVSRLSSELSLTPDQVGKVTAIVQEQHAKMKQAREETRQRIEAVLTPEQVAKFKAMKAAHKHHSKPETTSNTSAQ